jgi:NADPH2:quinone reductase
VAALGEGVTRLRLGDRVTALLPGGGYAEYSIANESNVMLLPPGLSMVEAAALPESFLAVWLNLFERGQFKSGESVLIHGGASGIGTTATMLSKAFGASKIITTVISDAHRQTSLELGADIVVNSAEEDFVGVVQRATGGSGVDVIVDILGGDYVAGNYRAAAMNGRIIQIGVVAGLVAKEVDISLMLIKRLTHTGSTLRSRTPTEKAQLIRSLEEQVWPLLATGTIKPLIYQTFPLAQARQAHELMDSGKHHGKIVLTMDAA